LAKAVAQGRSLPLRIGQLTAEITLPRSAAPVLAAIDGRRNLTEIAGAAGLDALGFGTVWAQVEAALAPWGLLLYSGLLRTGERAPK
jgi:hypothetical protein